MIKIKKINSVFFTLLAIHFLIACGESITEEPKLTLDSRYEKIDRISTFANCRSPEGEYTTEIVSTADGNLFFSQVYSYRDSPFSAKITTDNQGFVIDQARNITDTLPPAAIEMISSHDFHRIQTAPKQFFQQITFSKTLNDGTQVFQAIDRLNYPVSLYYVPQQQQISKVELLNPIDTTEMIEIIHNKWETSDYGALVKELEIIQAQKDTFHFAFEKIEIN